MRFGKLQLGISEHLIRGWYILHTRTSKPNKHPCVCCPCFTHKSPQNQEGFTVWDPPCLPPGRSTDHGRGRDQPKVRGETPRLSTPARALMPPTSSVKPATRRPTAGRPSPGPLSCFKGRPSSSRRPAATFSRLLSHSRCLQSCRLELPQAPQASSRTSRMKGLNSAERSKGR